MGGRSFQFFNLFKSAEESFSISHIRNWNHNGIKLLIKGNSVFNPSIDLSGMRLKFRPRV